MNVILPCMGWVPICWRELLGFFSINTEGVDDSTLLDPAVADKPPNNPMIKDSLDNLSTIEDSLGFPLDNPLDAHVLLDKPLSKLHVDLPDLPNSIIEDILSRLSPKWIFQCQRESKALQVLTQNPYFITRMQQNHSSPVIILQSIPKFVCDGNMELYFIDVENNTVERKLFELDSCYMQKDNPILLIGSHDGFLLFTNNRCSLFKQDPVFYVWNPITNQKKAIFCIPPPNFHVCGFYFCSLRSEYVLLLVSRKGAPFEFKMYNFGTKSLENVGNFSYPPSCDRPAVIVDKTLYWMVDYFSFYMATCNYPSDSHFVMSIEIETKKFGTIGQDGLFGTSVPDRYQLRVHLFEIEEELYICDTSSCVTFELSVLNQKTKYWVKKHIVILPIGVFSRKQPYGSTGCWLKKFAMEVFHYKKGELLVRDDERLFIYNLDSRTCRLVESKGLEDSNFQTVLHTDSLLSISDG